MTELKTSECSPAESIFLDDGKFRDSEKLHDFLRDLYLGPEACYILEFNRTNLDNINKIFDHIILKYGITSVSFMYRTS